MTYPGLIQNYGDLQSAIQDWAWRTGDTNFIAASPTFVQLFEAQFKRKRRVLDMEVGPLTYTLTGGAPATVTLPADFLEAIRLQLINLPQGTPNQRLTYVTLDRAGMLDATTAPGGVPQWYTILGSNFVINPQKWVPAGATVELVYYGFTPLATANGGMNWLLTKHPDLYLFGSLLMGAAYIDDKETVAQWKALAGEGIEDLLEADKRARNPGPLVMTPSVQFRTQRRRYPIPSA